MSGVLRTLSMCVPVALVDAPAAPAQAIAPATLPADIPAQPLPQALEEFARHTGLQLVYVSSVVRDKRSRAVSAGLSVTDGAASLRIDSMRPSPWFARGGHAGMAITRA